MRSTVALFMCLLAAYSAVIAQTPNSKTSKAAFLAELTWQEAERVLTPDTIVVIPLGAAAKAHGPHLPLATDFIQAEFWKDRVAERFEVVIAPTVNYGYYPPFIEYPGSTTMGLSNAKGMITDICRSLARFGVRRFYVINQGVSTNAALEPAAAELHDSGIILKFTNVARLYDVVRGTLKQVKGTHADEVETSAMLYIAPSAVNMKKADKDYGQQQGAGIWPTRSKEPVNPLYTIYNPSGTYGDATLATKAKGRVVVDTMLSMITRDLEELRQAELPKVRAAADRFGRFIGKYRISAGDEVAVSLEGESLVVKRTAGPRMVLLNSGPNKFELHRTELTFLTDNTGRVTHLLYYRDGNPVLAGKID